MITKHLQTLEYPQVLNRLSRYASFSGGKALAQALNPSSYFSEAIEWQAQTTEARRLLADKPAVGAGGAKEVRPLLEKARRGMIIVPQDLLSIARTLEIARTLRRQITPLADQYPRLADIAWRLEENMGVVSAVNQAIDESGAVKDTAGPALARIRREIDIVHSRLQEKMRRLVGSRQVSKYLQEGFITQRDGRYVLPVKADFKGRVKGIIHDQSASGATIFVEPISVVDLNNQWKTLQLEENQEINRILAALTAKIAEQSKFIAATVQALAELDLIFAKARYAEATFAAAPVLHNRQTAPANTPRLNLKSARHPLLNPETVVPIDLYLEPEINMLVITGPNTGGKTVSLKTAGLLTLMAQAGLHLPANAGSSLMVFDAVFADIGDEQSLEQSLSTFSAHMTNIVNILDTCSAQSLIILDELGAGTDPIEGAALAHAILRHLLGKSVTTLVATHYAELKAFAYTTPGVANAGMAFDLESLSPTFKLQIGVPGNSNAFAVARRLGLKSRILREARELVDKESRQTEIMLAQIKSDQKAARLERLRLEEERAEAEHYRQKIEDRLNHIEEEERAILKRARAEAQKELDTTRADLRHLRREAQKALAAQPASSGKTPAKLPKPVKATLQKIEADLQAKIRRADLPKMPERPARPLKVGDKVAVPHLDAKGVVTAMSATRIEVQLGHFRTTLNRRNIRPLQKNTPLPEVESAVTMTGGGLVDSPGLEIDLRGLQADEALHRLDSYLDQAYLAGLPSVTLIHGRGAGVLRAAVRDMLRGHPLVASYRPGKEGEGGDGVTVARPAVG